MHAYERGRWNHFLTHDAWRRTRFNAESNPLAGVKRTRGAGQNLTRAARIAQSKGGTNYSSSRAY